MNVPAARPAPQRCGPDHGVEVALRMRGRAQGSARSLRERLVGARRRGRSAAAGNGLQAPRAGALLDDDAADHAGALVGPAVVPVLTGNVELGGVLLAGGVEEVLRGELVDVDAPGDVVLVEHDVVGEATVVDPGDGVPLADGDLSGLEDEAARVRPELHVGSLGGEGHGHGRHGGDAGTGGAVGLVFEPAEITISKGDSVTWIN